MTLSTIRGAMKASPSHCFQYAMMFQQHPGRSYGNSERRLDRYKRCVSKGSFWKDSGWKVNQDIIRFRLREG
ncbi:hypothetical protein PM082_000766 [Marasmius tenuissimus]|nr:hypothetical protein PM082_000766 [Marasmius tenuissimus]